MSESSEKRRFTRLPLKANVHLDEGDAYGLVFLYSSNISRGGIFVVSEFLLDAGEDLNLEFDLPLAEGTINIKTTGIVRWQQFGKIVDSGFAPPGMGIQFKDLDPYQQKAIDKFIVEFHENGRSASPAPKKK